MAVPVAKKLLEAAQAEGPDKKRLTTKERRLVVAYLMATQPDVTCTEMGETFGVTERTIRLDKKYIREEKARFIKEDDVGLIIADIALDFERQVMDIENSKRSAKKGSAVYLQHCTAIMDLRLKMVKSLQDIGYVPKNLGNMTIKKFDYKAIVSTDGSISHLRSTDIAPAVIDAEVIEPKALAERNENSPTGSTESSYIASSIEPSDSDASAVGATQATS